MHGSYSSSYNTNTTFHDNDDDVREEYDYLGDDNIVIVASGNEGKTDIDNAIIS
jgi:hypothetical protein